MTATKVHISDLHADHVQWLSELEFSEQELDHFEKVLGKVLVDNTESEVTAKGEQLQNRLIREREVIETLLHDVRVSEQALAREAQEHPVAIDHKLYNDHATLRENMSTFSTLNHELKSDFNRFVGQWL